MLHLWSRAGQQVGTACNGRCSSCRSNFIGRINCWATSVRASRYHSGTFSYSAILATACIFDVNVKAARNKQWDEALANAREEVAAVEKSTQETAARLSKQSSRVSAAAQSPDGPFSWEAQDDQTWPELSIETVIKYPTEAGAARPRFPATFLPVTSKWGANDLPPQSLWSSDVRRNKAAQRAPSEKTTCITEVSVMCLILRLLHLVGISGSSKEQLAEILGSNNAESLATYAELSSASQIALVSQLAQYTDRNICSLSPWQSDDRPDFPITSPHYRHHTALPRPQNLRFIRHHRKQMIYRLYKAFSSYHSREMTFKSLVARVCNNLLTSPVQPDIDALNMLLVGFQSARAKDDVRDSVMIFLASYQHWTATRVNEIYCATYLRHYQQMNDLKRFTKFISLMRGQKRGLMLARPETLITEASQGRLRRRPSGKVNQAAHPMPLVYWEMIKGILYFAGFKEVVQICKGLQQDGWGLDWRCIWSLMMDCIRRADFEDGKIVWREILLLAQATRKIPRFVFCAMLAFCRVCQQEEDYVLILQESVEQGYDATGMQDSVYSLLASVAPDVAAAYKKEVDGLATKSQTPGYRLRDIFTLDNAIVIGPTPDSELEIGEMITNVSLANGGKQQLDDVAGDSEFEAEEPPASAPSAANSPSSIGGDGSQHSSFEDDLMSYHERTNHI